ncbi:dual specificity kinase TTK isoform X1, partial [Paramuricea clavata]
MDVATKTPKEWLQFITNERQTYSGPNKYKYWMQLYRRAADSIPANEFAHNNNAYAKIMVDFAKLQARTSEDDARTIFQAARSNVKHCSLIYVAWAQFELLNNNRKKCIKLLEKGKQFCAKPGYLLDIALENFKSGNDQLIDDETEEYTFTELINTNVCKTEDLTDRLVKTKQRTSDSSSESTSSSIGAFSPDSAHLTESSEESDDVIFLKNVKPLRSTNLSSIDEGQPACISPKEDVEQNITSVSTTTSYGRKIGQPNATTFHSSFLNDILKEKQLNLATLSKPAVSIEENVTCGNNHTTIKPSSNEITPQQLTTQCSTEVEFKVPNLKCSNAKNIFDTTPSEPRKENFEEPAFPVFRSTRSKGHSASSSESGDDIDALSSLKKSLLNIGNKTGLMDFATPRNKSSDQILATTTDNNIVGGSLVKERKSNRRTNRSVFVGLPKRVPKPMKDESRARKGEQERTNGTNTGMIESLIQTKENDSIDGVYAFPQDPPVDRHIEANLKHNGNASTQIYSSQVGSDLRQRMPLASIALNANKNIPTNLESPQYKLQNAVRHGANLAQAVPEVCPKKNIDSVAYTSNWKRLENDLSHSDIPKFNPFCHSTPATEKANAIPTRISTQSAPQETNFTIYPLSKPQLQKQNETASGVYVSTGEESCKDSGPNFQSVQSNQTLSSNNSSHLAICTPNNIVNHPEDSAEVKTSSTSVSNDSRLKSVSLTLPNSSISMNSRCANSGHSQLNNSISGFQSDMKDVSRMSGENHSTIQSITVNGKVYRKLNIIGRGGSSE